MGVAAGRDRYSLVISFKSTLLEGLEVAFIVITLGANQGATAVAAAGAVVALVAVVIVGVVVRKPLSRVPENTLKFTVGVMLTSFGTFWAGEGVGIDWPGDEASLAGLIVLTARVVAPLRAAAQPLPEGRDGVRGLWHGIVDFVVGDDIWIAIAVLVLLAVAAAAVHFGADAWWLLAAGVPAALWVSLQRAQRAAGKAS